MKTKHFSLLFLPALLLFAAPSLHAAEAAVVGQITGPPPVVMVDGKRVVLAPGTSLEDKALIRGVPGTRFSLKFPAGVVLYVEGDARLRSGPAADPANAASVELIQGTVYCAGGVAGPLEVRTSAGLVSITSGTRSALSVRSRPGSELLTVDAIEGAIAVKNHGTDYVVAAGNRGLFTSDGAPSFEAISPLALNNLKSAMRNFFAPSSPPAGQSDVKLPDFSLFAPTPELLSPNGEGSLTL